MAHISGTNGQPKLGYLGENGLLYCSSRCAAEAGRRKPYVVDEEDLDALMESEGLHPGILCAQCGGAFPVSWPGRESE
jgi:hypothetical protein